MRLSLRNPSSVGIRFLSHCLLACAILLLSSAISLAVQPQVSSFKPAGLQRGTTVEFVVTGNRLDDAAEFLFYEPGLQVTEITPDKDGNKFAAKLTAAADCPLGIHAFRVRTTSGVSNMKTVLVGALPSAEEKEPNNDFAQPQKIERNVTVMGAIAGEDVDYFAIEAKRGERITVELEGLRLGNTLFDPYVSIMNMQRYELVRSDDEPLLHQDCLASIVAPDDGQYVIQVRESAYGPGSGYRLHVGTFPRPRAVYPAGGKPGEELSVRFLGDVAGELTQTIKLPARDNSVFEAFATDAQGIAPSANRMRVIDLPNVLEAEPNNEMGQVSQSQPAPAAFNGIIQSPGDVDLFKFSAKKGEQYDVRVYARQVLRSPLDSVVAVLTEKGQQLFQNDDTGGPDSYVRFNAPGDGEYFVSVRDHLRDGNELMVYRVEVTPVKPALTLTIPERTQYIPTTLTVPKNNRMAIMYGAQRANFGGKLLLDFANLPSHVAYEAVPMIADRSETPILFTADGESQPAGALVSAEGRAEDAAINVRGGLSQRTMLVRGGNNNDVWGHTADRMTMVVSDEIPFKIDLVQPKAPLVKNGSLDLKVVATRAPGFTAPITLRLLYSPPGVSSSNSVVIPEGKTEGMIPMTAANNAALGEWKLVALGSADHQGASIECATQFVNLNVIDQFYAFTFERTAIEVGKSTELTVKIEKKADFEGEATAELLGLPSGVTSTSQKFTKDATEIVFPLTADATPRVGKHAGVVCRTVFQMQGEPVTHTLGSTDLRVDQPLPPKVAAPAKVATTPAANPGEPKKRLSRLEQLRVDKDQGK